MHEDDLASTLTAEWEWTCGELAADLLDAVGWWAGLTSTFGRCRSGLYKIWAAAEHRLRQALYDLDGAPRQSN